MKLGPLTTACLGLALSGCGSLATSPMWVGGGMAVTGPVRIAAEEAAREAEAKRMAARPKEIAARHILVMHKRSKAKPKGVTRTRDEAKARAQKCLERLRAGEDFAAMVTEYSDEPGAKTRAGDLGTFDQQAMVRTFTDAAFELKRGEISEVVETPYGFHVIQRTR